MELKDILDSYLADKMVEENLDHNSLSSLALDMEYTLYNRLGYTFDDDTEEQNDQTRD